MLRSGLFSALALFACLVPTGAQTAITRENGYWVRTITGTASPRQRLRINAHGPVTLEGGVARDLSYTVVVRINARTEFEARHILQQYFVRVENQGAWTVLTAPGGPALTSIQLRGPSLSNVTISTSEGAVQASGIEGLLDVDSGAGDLSADRIGGDCKLVTCGGGIRVGEVKGALHGTTGAGHINVKTVGGEAVLETSGGDIIANIAGGAVQATTAGGGVHIGAAGGAVTASSGGGEIIVEKAGGPVSVRNMAGPVQIHSAAGVRCESGSGGVRLSNISGPMRVSTSMGSILANLFGSRLTDSYLATGSGDITVLIPSNLGVTIQAQNSMADTLRRIMSDFREIQARRQGPRVIAEGSLNGGGPVLQISGMGGTIFLRRQQ